MEKLRQRLHNQLEIDIEAQEQIQHLKDELVIRTNEASRLRSTVENLEQSCEKLHEEIKSCPTADAISDLEAQIEKV